MKLRKMKLALSSVMVVSPVFALAAEQEVTAPRIGQALEATFGVHQGERRNHIKGTCAVGEFTATAEAARYSRSALFSGQAVPVIARFSLAGEETPRFQMLPKARVEWPCNSSSQRDSCTRCPC